MPGGLSVSNGKISTDKISKIMHVPEKLVVVKKSLQSLIQIFSHSHIKSRSEKVKSRSLLDIKISEFTP